MYNESKILTIFLSLRDVVVIGDNDMVITDLNKAAIDFFGWSVDDVRGKSITFLVPTHPLDVQDNTATLMARLADSTEVPVVIQTTRDPHATMVAWTILPVQLPRVFEFGVHMNIRAALTPKLSVADLDFADRRVFLRVDFNVPIDRATGLIRDDSRIRAAQQTMEKILSDGGRLILGSHLGRPKGRDSKKSLQRIVPILQELLKRPIKFVDDIADAPSAVSAMTNGDVILLENLRFNPGEDSKDTAQRNKLALALANLCDIYVCDAFGTVHRMTASMTGVPRFLGAGVTGFLIEREIRAIGMVMQNPTQPLVAIVGGAKVSDKINVLASIFNFAHTVVIGGAMAYTFLEAQGYSMGASRVERVVREKGREVDLLATARELIELAKARKVNLILPSDHSCASAFHDETPHFTKNANIPEKLLGLDIGPKTIERVREGVAAARTLIWNGPVGVFEFAHFAAGTEAIGEAIKANTKLVSIVGGGETAAATTKYREYITHVSTGGGAFLDLLEGHALPGLVCLTARSAPKL